MPDTVPTVCLASGSAVRAQLLQAAGVDFDIDPADIDEAAAKAAYAGGPHKPSLAAELARQKARRVAGRRPQSLIIGADQTLTCEGESFDKPADIAAARETLGRLRGRRHVLTTAICVAHGDQLVWQYQSEAVLEMRAFSDLYLEHYLDAVGDSILSSVGAYHLENQGAQLFSAIEGDYFTILGLPLIPLLEFLRREGALIS